MSRNVVIGNNSAQLEKASKRFGVQKEYLIALWGMESSFGYYQGNYDVLSVLATLAFDGCREALFSKGIYCGNENVGAKPNSTQQKCWDHGPVHGTNAIYAEFIFTLSRRIATATAKKIFGKSLRRLCLYRQLFAYRRLE